MGPIYNPEASVPNHLRCVTTQKTEDLISITAKAEGHAHLVCDKEGCGWNFSRYSDVVPRYQKWRSAKMICKSLGHLFGELCRPKVSTNLLECLEVFALCRSCVHVFMTYRTQYYTAMPKHNNKTTRFVRRMVDFLFFVPLA